MSSSSAKSSGRGCIGAAACAAPGLVLAQLCLAQAALAQSAAERELTWFAEAGVEHTDNVGRRAVDEESETVGLAAVSLALNTHRPRLEADIAAHAEYRDYLDDAFESEVVGGLDGSASYAFSPERFYWTVTDNFGQIANQRALADAPDNRQNFNYFTTGPDITLPLGRRTSLQLSGRFADSYYENTIEDNQSLTGSAALIRRMSEISSLSLNGSTSKIEYDEEELFGEYRLDQAYLRWATVTERTTLALDGGYTTVEQGGETSDGLLARLEFSREVAARSRIGLNLGTEYSTAGRAFRLDQDLTGIETGADDAVAARDPYQLDYAYLNWTTDWERSAFTAVLSARSESHEVATEDDRDAYAAAIALTRQVSRRLDASLHGGYNEEEFVNQNFRFDEWNVGLGLSWLLGERVSVVLRLDHYDGSSDDGTRDYDENRGYLGIAYSRGGS